MTPTPQQQLKRIAEVAIMSSQTKLESFIETCINTAIGYAVAFLSQLLVFPIVGIHVPISTNLEIGAWFTLISVVRGYVIRRWFNARLKQAARHLAAGGQGS